MADVIPFVPKAELDRLALIRQARAIYQSIFPDGVVIPVGPIVGGDVFHPGEPETHQQ